LFNKGYTKNLKPPKGSKQALFNKKIFFSHSKTNKTTGFTEKKVQNLQQIF
jgi:hypothetical protein